MADKDEIQTEGREDNAAQPLNASKNTKGPERYPQARKDDGFEPHSFDGVTPAPRSRTQAPGR